MRPLVDTTFSSPLKNQPRLPDSSMRNGIFWLLTVTVASHSPESDSAIAGARANQTKHSNRRIPYRVLGEGSRFTSAGSSQSRVDKRCRCADPVHVAVVVHSHLGPPPHADDQVYW